MSSLTGKLTQRERELGAIINSYNEVTEQLKQSHEQLREEVRRLRQELARKNRQLRRRERLAALGELAAGVAHEIRNPLSAIELFASLLARDLKDRPAQRRLVGKISKGVGKLESIVSDILEFGRPSEPDPVRVRLDAVARETIELAYGKIEECGVAVEVSGALAGVEVITDRVLLQRGLLNLLINGLEATASGTSNGPRRVVIGLGGGTDDQVTVTVADEGPGVDPEIMDRIFDPFFTTKDNGSGLGLAIVHQIAESLGGSVRAANRSCGGAVFSLCLPRRPLNAGPLSVNRRLEEVV